MSKGKILIVEDQSLISTNIKLLLKFNDFEIQGIAPNAELAIEMIEKEKPDLILMDISLPGRLDGIEATDLINKKWRIPIIFLTIHTDPKTIKRAKESEAYGYITKDIQLKDQLPILIEFVLYKHKMELEHLHTQNRLSDSEEKFRTIVSSAKDAIIFLDNKAKISFWNEAATDIFGFTVEEALGKHLHQLIAPDSYMKFFVKGFTDFTKKGEGDFIGKTIELMAIKKNGETFPIESSLSSFKIKDKWCACSIIRDITSRKNTEAEMERLIEELQISKEIIEKYANELLGMNSKLTENELRLSELNASKDKFFSIIAHDLKGPFQGLIGYSEILSKDIDSLTKDEIKEFATDLHFSSKQLFKLLENLLQWTRIQRGVIECIPVNLSLKQITALNIDLISINAVQKYITLFNDVPDECYVLADLNMVNTILRNLLSNSVKFTRKNGDIKISAENYQKNYVMLKVEDNGVGMDEAQKSKMFRIDAHNTTLGTHNEKGTGLGLILCKELVEKNGGKIWVESEEGVGTTFYVTLRIGDKNADNVVD